MLSKDEFIALDPNLSLLLANGLIEKTHPKDGPGELGLHAWRFREQPGDTLVEINYIDAESAAYARYHALRSSFNPEWA